MATDNRLTAFADERLKMYVNDIGTLLNSISLYAECFEDGALNQIIPEIETGKNYSKLEKEKAKLLREIREANYEEAQITFANIIQLELKDIRSEIEYFKELILRSIFEQPFRFTTSIHLSSIISDIINMAKSQIVSETTFTIGKNIGGFNQPALGWVFHKGYQCYHLKNQIRCTSELLSSMTCNIHLS